LELLAGRWDHPILSRGHPASLTAPLAEAEIRVFALSTFDTDYLLVKAKNLEKAVEALRGQGHNIR
jgi:hypothetical protein